jgi:voltage-gated potassium channel Kch
MTVAGFHHTRLNFHGTISGCQQQMYEAGMKPLRDVNTDFEKRGHRALLATLLLVILSSPFLHQYPAFSWLFTLFVILVLLAAVRTVSSRQGEFRIALVLAVLTLTSQLGVLLGRFEWLEVLRYAATASFLFWVAGMMLRDIVVRSERVTLELILGAVNVYLMAGIGFAFGFGLIERLQPGSFTGLDLQIHASAEVLPFLYFSFVTLTTLGYGDITPITPMGTTVSYFEAMFGQLFLAIMVARLVGLYVANPDKAGKDG